LKKSFMFFFSIFLPLSLLITGCGNNQAQQKNENKLSIYTTVYPLQYFTEQIGGEFVEVNSIYPPGSDEHTFEPSQRDMMNLVDADLFFYVGLGLEGFVNKAKETLKNEEVTIVSTAKNLPINEENEATDAVDDHGHSIDPHVWLDPVYAEGLAENIKNALIDKLPEQRDTFEKNYQALSKELHWLNKSLEETIQNAKHKEIIVAHAAFGYWEKRYGLEQISISGLSTTNEPSQKKLEEIISKAKQDHIKYIIFEQNVSSKLTDIVKNEIDAEPLTLHNLSVLTKENIKNNETYITIMKDNIETLKKALNY
jgi:zinc transport system substrate-binding protein